MTLSPFSFPIALISVSVVFARTVRHNLDHPCYVDTHGSEETARIYALYAMRFGPILRRNNNGALLIYVRLAAVLASSRATLSARPSRSRSSKRRVLSATLRHSSSRSSNKSSACRTKHASRRQTRTRASPADISTTSCPGRRRRRLQFDSAGCRPHRPDLSSKATSRLINGISSD